MTHILYWRHFAWLTVFSVLVALTNRWLLASDISLSFAIYGALHALALVLALRARQSLRRMTLFIGVAAALSVMALHAGLAALKLFGVLPGSSGLYAALGLAAMIGALAYGISIRRFKIYELRAGELALICVGCAAGAYAAFLTLARFHVLGRWWLAVLWWYAFSIGLWYCDFRRRGQSPP